ncbi:MAG: L,D-transpeptidase [Bdellovibrionota bacterium]
MLLRITFIFCLMCLLNTDAHARTYPASYFADDPGANSSHIFGTYRTVKGIYSDPNFNEALMASSPLENPKFQNNDVIVLINIDNSIDSVTSAPLREQTIRVYVRESLVRSLGVEKFAETNYDTKTGLVFYWKVSTARAGKTTPYGYFVPQLFSSDHRSSIYEDAFMPWAVFFSHDIALHGTYMDSISQLGSKASAGCVRLEPQRAKDIFHLIGFSKNTLISVQ